MDLAGTGQGDGNAGSKSQKAAAGKVDKITVAEGAAINKSLTTLGMVMTALAKNANPPKRDASSPTHPKKDTTASGGGGVSKPKHVPYRDSTLTWLLKAAFGGNSKTVLLASVSPCTDHYEESVSTLKFAERAKNVINTAKTKLTKSRAVLDAEAEAARLAEEVAISYVEKKLYPQVVCAT